MEQMKGYEDKKFIEEREEEEQDEWEDKKEQMKEYEDIKFIEEKDRNRRRRQMILRNN